MSKEFSSLYLDLDVLMDTRLGTLYTYFGAELTELALKDNYYQRLFDKFPKIKYDDFKEVYKLRDKRVLKNSIKTNFSKFIREFIITTEKNNANTPYFLFPKIILNIYPYELNDNDIYLLLELLQELTNEKADCQIVNFNIEELTPLYIKNNIDILAIYDYHLWLETHSKNDNLKKITCPEVTMIAPMMFKKFPLSQQEMHFLKTLKASPFDVMKAGTNVFINIEFLSVEVFSFFKVRSS